MSKGLDYYGLGRRPDPAGIDGEGFHSRRAMIGMLFSLSATCAAIGVAMLEPPPTLRRAALLLIALGGSVGAITALLALRRRISQADRTLVACGIVLGALSFGAAVKLF